MMITQRFRPILWVGGVAIAATSLYLISLQVASEHKRLVDVDNKILATRHEIRLLKTELSARSNVRQLEKWNEDASLALAAPRAGQYVDDLAALDHFDPKSLKAHVDQPTAAMAAVTAHTVPNTMKTTKSLTATTTAATATTTAHNAPKVVRLEEALAQVTERKIRP